MKNSSRSICKRCGAKSVKGWDELDSDEKLLAERLPISARYPFKERKRHRLCTKCWHEETGDLVDLA